MIKFHFHVEWQHTDKEIVPKSLWIMAKDEEVAWDQAWAWYREERERRTRSLEPNYGKLKLVGRSA